MINIKPGVTFHQDMFVFPEVMRIIYFAQRLSPDGYSVTITSGCDGEHKDTSKHWSGKAIDFRTKDFPEGCSVVTWAERLRNKLGDQYFVLVEPNHLHVQWNG